MRGLGIWVAVGILAGCTDGTSTPLVGEDGGVDASVDSGPVCEGAPPLEAASATPHAEPFGSSATEARAGRLVEADLPPDPEELLTWRAGDYVLANDRVAVVIEDARASDGYDPFGGKLAGMAAVEGGRMVRPADFNEIILGIGRYTVVPESVGVRDAGGEGPAVIRVVGALRPIPFADDLAAAVAPFDYDDLGVAIDYSLAPGASHVDVTVHLASPRTNRARAQLLLLTFQTYRMPAFAPERGFDLGSDPLSFVGFADDDATSYAIAPGDDELRLLLEVSGAVLFQGQNFEAAGCTTTEILLARIHVGGPGMDGLLAAMREENGVEERVIEGTITGGDGEPAAGVRVHAESADMARYLSRATTDAEGRYRLHVDASETVRLRAFRVGEGIVEIPSGETDVTLPELGAIAVAASGADGPLPVRVQTQPLSAAEPAVPRRWGEPDRPERRTHVVFPTDGQVTLPVLPGTHRVIVSRGFEYDLFESDVTVTAGATTNVPVMLERVVDTTGVMCADYHIHTNRSPDSQDPARFKLHSAAGDGVDIPCRSDHEWVVSWEDLVMEEGLGAHLFGVTSLELTTFAWGHFGVVPIQPRPNEPNNGAPVWAGRNPPEVFAEVRDRPEAPLLIINHPRGAAIGGYLTAVGYDAATGTVRNPELWDDDFGALETFNDSSFDESSEQVADWFSFLRSGRRVWAVGSSDTHHVMRGSPVGYPRTCLQLGTDDPNDLRGDDGENRVRDATAAGSFTVSGGVYVDAWARGDVGPGGEVTGAAARESVRVRVQAAPWVDVDALEVWVDGELTQTIPLEATGDVVRFDDAIEVGGDFVIFHAKGDRDLSPAIPGRMPFGVTQPIFFVR